MISVTKTHIQHSLETSTQLTWEYDTLVDRLHCRQGLRIYHQKFPSEQFLTQSFDTNLPIDENQQNSMWEGSTKDGCTIIRSGPDYNKINATLIFPDGSDLAIKERLQVLNPTNNAVLSIFVGTYETAEEAILAMRGVNNMLCNLGRYNDAVGMSLKRNHYMSGWRKGARTLSELQLGLRPCGLCHQTFSTKKCSSCKFQWYCCVEHQKDDWSRHKPICKEARARRKKASKTIKSAKTTVQEDRIKAKEINTSLKREVLSPPATQKEKDDVSKLYASLFGLCGSQLDVWSKLQLFKVIDAQPRFWSILMDFYPDFLIKIEGFILECDGLNDRDKKRWKPVQTPCVGGWFCSVLLRGMTETGTKIFNGCNAMRTTQFMVNTDRGFESMLVCLHGTLQKLLHPKVGCGEVQRFYDRSIRSLHDFLCFSVLCNKKVGGAIVAAHLGKPNVVSLFKQMLDMVDDPKNDKYDLGNPVQNEPPGVLRPMFNNLIGVVDAWTEKLQVHGGFFAAMETGRGNRYIMYRIKAYRMSKIMVDKGRKINDEERNLLDKNEEQDMWKLVQELEAEKRLKKKKKKTGKGRKGKRR